MKAPKKIYITKNLLGELRNGWDALPSDAFTNIEYTRTDAFIEKACDLLADNYSKYITTNGLATIFSATIDFDTIRMIEDFKKAMEK